jgi:hypothetical protein
VPETRPHIDKGKAGAAQGCRQLRQRAAFGREPRNLCLEISNEQRRVMQPLGR